MLYLLTQSSVIFNTILIKRDLRGPEILYLNLKLDITVEAT